MSKWRKRVPVARPGSPRPDWIRRIGAAMIQAGAHDAHWASGIGAHPRSYPISRGEPDEGSGDDVSSTREVVQYRKLFVTHRNRAGAADCMRDHVATSGRPHHRRLAGLSTLVENHRVPASMAPQDQNGRPLARMKRLLLLASHEASTREIPVARSFTTDEHPSRWLRAENAPRAQTGVATFFGCRYISARRHLGPR